MKKTVLLLAALLVTAAAGAQNFMNVTYGVASLSYKYGDMPSDNIGASAVMAGYSHNWGLSSSLGLEPGLDFVYEFRRQDQMVGEIRCNYLGLQAPVLLNYAIPVADQFTFKLFAGPVLHYGITDKISTYVNGDRQSTVDDLDSGDRTRLNVSAALAMAGEWRNTFRLRAGYSYGITDLDKSEGIENKEGMFTISLGYIF